jgi:PadR family transcriptional regulator PadR
MAREPKAELLQGTLDMLILKALTQSPLHGYGLARWIEATTHDALSVEEGSLYPELYRMDKRGWIESEWGTTDSNRRAKFYSLTRKGRKQLHAQMAAWDRFVTAVRQILEAQPAY